MSKSDLSFDIEPRSKGSYRRALDDIGRALLILKADRLEPVASFLFYYLACEKLAKIMKGVCKRKKKTEMFKRNSQTPNIDEIEAYSKQLGCKISIHDIGDIFSGSNLNSARYLRNQIVHEIGPSHAKQIVNEAWRLVPKMQRFIECRHAVVQYIVALRLSDNVKEHIPHNQKL